MVADLRATGTKERGTTREVKSLRDMIYKSLFERVKEREEGKK